MMAAAAPTAATAATVAPTQTVLEVAQLRVTLSPEFAVEVDALRLRRGAVVVLDAPSGAGKSTVLGLISGAIEADRPEATTRHRIDGQDIAGTVPPPEALGFVLQTSALVPYLTVAENIDLPAAVRGVAPDPEWRSYLTRVLGLATLEHRKPAAISVGQRQRAGIARAFLLRPKVVLLDEPVSALDPDNVNLVEGLIAHLAEDADAGIVLASHQAARGAFADSPRARHRLERRGGCLVSVFGAA